MRVYKIKQLDTGLYWTGTNNVMRDSWLPLGKVYGEKRHAKAAVAIHKLTEVSIVEFDCKEVGATKCSRT